MEGDGSCPLAHPRIPLEKEKGGEEKKQVQRNTVQIQIFKPGPGRCLVV
jgi:hypothetical protein